MSRKSLVKCLIGVAAVLLTLYLILAGPGILLAVLMRGMVVYEENERVQSPDGKVDAVLIVRREGATGTNHYMIYVVPSGVKVREKHLGKGIYECVFYAKYLRGREIVWLNDRLLEIRYENAEILDSLSSAQPFRKKGQTYHDYVVGIQLKAKEETVKTSANN